jgi:hypothetical protein
MGYNFAYRKVSCGILRKQSRTVDKGWSSSFRTGIEVSNPSPYRGLGFKEMTSSCGI